MSNKKHVGRPSKRPEYSELLKLYSHFTAKQLADVYDVSESTVRSWVCRGKAKERDVAWTK